MASLFDSLILPVDYLNQPKMILLSILITTILLYFLKNTKKRKKYPPGPIGLPIVGYLPFLGAEPHKTLLKLSERFGSKIISLRFGRRLTVVLNDYDTVKEVLCHPAALDKDANFVAHIPEVGFASSNGKEWQEQRRFTMQTAKDLGFGRDSWQTFVQEEVHNFTKLLTLYGGKPVDIYEKLSYVISNNIISLVFGLKFQHSNENDVVVLLKDYVDACLSYSGALEITTIFPRLRPILEYFRIGGYYKSTQIISKFHDIIRNEITKHKTHEEYKDAYDFMNIYLRKIQQKDGHFFSERNLEGNVSALFLGASDTIYSSLTWLFPLMALYPEIQSKVQQELDEVIGREGRISYEERYRIPYTFAVLMEGQRYSTIVPLTGPRQARSDIEVQGYLIPKGAAIAANIWAIHNDPLLWEEPEKFNPERFLQESDRKLLKTPPGFMTFSVGKRNCPGEVVTWMEIMSFFTSVLQKFRISAPPGEKIKFENNPGLVYSLTPQRLCFVERT